ncbi:MAG: ABC transporter ATP-binding protein [Myxococcota bacterium]|jgi:lipopolysaccharide transport system ATP-binding protein|nr:ABC transporter ATP-binding protein [Myxococcota bacterium]
MSSDVAQPGEPAICIRGVAKTYRLYARPQDRLWELLGRGGHARHREVQALRSIDLDVGHGETLGIVGANGSGKSTLLRLICGTLEPTQGRVDVRGELAPLLTLGAGFHREFTGRENVLMSGAIQGMSRKEIEARLPEIEAFAEIGPFFDRAVKTYSTGMVARLAFSLAVHCDPEVLVIDEVLAVGDEAFNRKCFARIEAIKSTGATIVFVSHVAERVIELCDRAVLLDAGELLCEDEPKAVIARYKKLVHAPHTQRSAVRDEIIRGEADVEGDVDATAKPALDPALRSQSRVELRGERAQIFDPHLTDLHGAPVNQLEAGGVYRFRFEVEFREPARGVRFGMMIKPVTGAELAGQASHAADRVMEKVAGGSRLRVDFAFRAALAPGAYFLNAGVLARDAGFDGEEERYLHRILDATMFRVVQGEPTRATGRVDLTVDDHPVSIDVVRDGV